MNMIDTNGRCILCKYGAELTKLRRRWVHHFPDTGKIVVCEDMLLKPSVS